MTAGPTPENIFLTGKVVLVLSPQRWGKMMLSKHHYALELARRGNDVYFLNPPDNDAWSPRSARTRITIRAVEKEPRLKCVDQTLFFPYALKFHARPVFDRLMQRQLRQILASIGVPIDLVWSFDLGNLIPLRHFSSGILKVFHPVDEPGDTRAIDAARGADLIFSVTGEILEKYKPAGIPSFLVNHGLSDEFPTGAAQPADSNSPFRVGMSGNLLRPDLDRPVLLQMIAENPGVEFHFFGSYLPRDSNIGAAADPAALHFSGRLQQQPNVRLHGVLGTAALAEALNGMDLLLICYDLQLDQSKGTNYHKVMEYLSTGKVIVSNNVTAYRGQPDLIRMIPDRDNNRALPALLADTLRGLEQWNAPVLQSKRKAYAEENRYARQFDRIDAIVRRTAAAKKKR